MRKFLRQKLIAIALVAGLACSSGMTSVFAATSENIELMNNDSVSSEAEPAFEQEIQSEISELETKNNMDEQAESINAEESFISPADTSVMNQAPSIRLTEVVIDEMNFPDANFRALIQNYDTDGNGALSDIEIAAVTTIDCTNQQIVSLQGIEYFTNLTHLDCSNNQLSNLDVSWNTNLISLTCRNNQLSNLDVSRNTALTHLDCLNNQLSNLDISRNTALTYLDCRNNQLDNLVTGLGATLETFLCRNNQLRNLDLSQYTAITYLDCSNNQLTNLDLGHMTNAIAFFGYNQQVHLSQIPADGYDLVQSAPNIVGDRITNPTGANFNGTVMSGYVEGTPITYAYDCGQPGGTAIRKLEVTLTFDVVDSRTDAEKYTPAGKDVQVKRNETPNAADGIANKEDLPQGTTYDWKTPVDTSTEGEKTGTVVVTYPDGTKDEVEVKVNVVDTRTDAEKYPPETIPETIKPGEKPDLSDNVTNLDKLPEGTVIKDITPEGSIDINTPGNYKGFLEITYPDGSKTIIEIPVIITQNQAGYFMVDGNPKTGDPTNSGLYSVGALGSLAALFGIVFTKKRKKCEKEDIQ